jgi:hypothetical protein
MMTPEMLATYPNRLTSNRSSAYSPPKWAEQLMKGLPSFDTRSCTSGITATIEEGTASSEAFQERTKGHTQAEAEGLLSNLERYAFNGHSNTAEIPAPACKQQAPFEPIYGSGPSTQYQHTFEQPNP